MVARRRALSSLNRQLRIFISLANVRLATPIGEIRPSADRPSFLFLFFFSRLSFPFLLLAGSLSLLRLVLEATTRIRSNNLRVPIRRPPPLGARASVGTSSSG